jgi:heme exporter protein D
MIAATRPAGFGREMEKVTAFFQMGGYAAFVWPSLGLTVAVMAGLLIATLRQLRIRQRRLAELEAAGAQRRRRGATASASSDGAGVASSDAREVRP